MSHDRDEEEEDTKLAGAAHSHGHHGAAHPRLPPLTPMKHHHWVRRAQGQIHLFIVPDERTLDKETEEFLIYCYSPGEDPLKSKRILYGEIRGGETVNVFEAISDPMFDESGNKMQPTRTISTRHPVPLMGRRIKDSGVINSRTREIEFMSTNSRWIPIKDPRKTTATAVVTPTPTVSTSATPAAPTTAASTSTSTPVPPMSTPTPAVTTVTTVTTPATTTPTMMPPTGPLGPPVGPFSVPTQPPQWEGDASMRGGPFVPYCKPCEPCPMPKVCPPQRECPPCPDVSASSTTSKCSKDGKDGKDAKASKVWMYIALFLFFLLGLLTVLFFYKGSKDSKGDKSSKKTHSMSPSSASSASSSSSSSPAVVGASKQAASSGGGVATSGPHQPSMRPPMPMGCLAGSAPVTMRPSGAPYYPPQ